MASTNQPTPIDPQGTTRAAPGVDPPTAPPPSPGEGHPRARVEPWEALSHFAENRARFPVQQLLPYVGQVIAWSPDGTHILAVGPSMETASKQLIASGEDPSFVVFEYLSSF